MATYASSVSASSARICEALGLEHATEVTIHAKVGEMVTVNATHYVTEEKWGRVATEMKRMVVLPAGYAMQRLEPDEVFEMRSVW